MLLPQPRDKRGIWRENGVWNTYMYVHTERSKCVCTWCTLPIFVITLPLQTWTMDTNTGLCYCFITILSCVFWHSNFSDANYFRAFVQMERHKRKIFKPIKKSLDGLHGVQCTMGDAWNNVPNNGMEFTADVSNCFCVCARNRTNIHLASIVCITMMRV